MWPRSRSVEAYVYGCEQVSELRIRQHGEASAEVNRRLIKGLNGQLRQRIASLISSILFLGFLWILFKKIIIVTWISMPWWALILLLVVLFFFIETMVARTVGAKEPVDRHKDAVAAGLDKATNAASTAGHESLDAVKARLRDFDKNRTDPPA